MFSFNGEAGGTCELSILSFISHFSRLNAGKPPRKEKERKLYRGTNLFDFEAKGIESRGCGGVYCLAAGELAGKSTDYFPDMYAIEQHIPIRLAKITLHSMALQGLLFLNAMFNFCNGSIVAASQPWK
ncbi:MAG: hypothetical protein ABI167_11940 [Nitrosospira sp.]